jgi:hypothetical protein
MEVWFRRFADDNLPITPDPPIIKHLILPSIGTEEVRKQITMLYNDPYRYLSELRELLSYATENPKPLIFIFDDFEISKDTWVSGLIEECDVVVLKNILFLQDIVDQLANAYFAKLFNVFYQISRKRKLLFISDELKHDPYNYTKLYIRSQIKTSEYVWIIHLRYGSVLCIRKPIHPDDLWTLLQKKGIKRTKRPMPTIEVSTRSEVFFHPSENAYSYSWVLNDYPHIAIDDLDITQEQESKNRKYLHNLDDWFEQTLKDYQTIDEAKIKQCAKECNIKYHSSMLWYRWVGPKQYLDCVRSHKDIQEFKAGEHPAEDLDSSFTPYGVTEVITEFKPLDRPKEQLVYLELWHMYGYLIFNSMISDIRTWLNRVHQTGWLKQQHDSLYLKRLPLYAQDILPEMYIVAIETVQSNNSTFTLGRISSDNHGNQYRYNTLNVWLPDSYIIIIETVYTT